MGREGAGVKRCITHGLWGVTHRDRSIKLGKTSRTERGRDQGGVSLTLPVTLPGPDRYRDTTHVSAAHRPSLACPGRISFGAPTNAPSWGSPQTQRAPPPPRRPRARAHTHTNFIETITKLFPSLTTAVGHVAMATAFPPGSSPARGLGRTRVPPAPASGRARTSARAS